MPECGACLGEAKAVAPAPCYLCDRALCTKCAQSRLSCARCYLANPILKDEAIKLLAWWGFDTKDPTLLGQAMDACDLAMGVYLEQYPAAERPALLRSAVPGMLQDLRDRSHIKPRANRDKFLNNPFGLTSISQ